MKYVRTANRNDVQMVERFLGQANISAVGLEDSIEDFLVVENEEGKIEGTLGIERHGKYALLRSLVISPSFKQHHILQLFEQAQIYAKKREVEKLFLFTNKASFASFFELLGFVPQKIEEVPSEIQQSYYVKETFSLSESKVLACEL
ncbi:GNAT family N-acetyltransferase [Sutcliffiella cohnii]